MEPVHVLVKVHADGYVELLGPPNVRARIVYVPVCQSPLQERLIEQQIDREIPYPYRYGPGEVRRTAFVRGMGVTYDEYQERLALVAQDQELIACLKSMAGADNSSAPPPAATKPSVTSSSGPAQNMSWNW